MKSFKLIKNILITTISIISLTVMSFLPVLDVPIANADECSSFSITDGGQSKLVGNKLYIGSSYHDIYVIDTTTNATVATIPKDPDTGAPYFGLPILVGTKLYITQAGSTDQSVVVIDTTTDTILTTIPLGITDLYYNIPVLVGTSLYITDRSNDTVIVVDTTTDTVLTTIPVEDSPTYMSLNGSKLYVGNDATAYAMSVIDTTNNTVTHTISTGLNVRPGFSISVDTNVYVIDRNNNNVLVIDAGTDTITATIPVGSYPEDIVTSGTKLYVRNYGSNDISVIDINTNTVIDTISLTKNPIQSIIVGDYLYVAAYTNPDPGTVSVIDINTNTVVSTISLTYSPSNIFLNLVGTNLYLIGSSSVDVIDTNTNTLAAIPCPAAPTVVNLPATLITQTSATINGEITDAGNLTITDRYFAYLKTSDFNNGNPDQEDLFQTPVEHGSYSAGQFSANISDLICGTDYLFVAFGMNSIGLGIALDLIGTFTTLPCVDDTPQPTPHRSSGGGISYGCKDPTALNYERFSMSDPKLCRYGSTVPTTPTTPITIEKSLCPTTQLLTQNLHAPSRNGVYNNYTKGIVKEAHILQAHLNRLGFNSGKEDGILGPISTGAIKRMQTFLKTTPDGYVGPITRGLINNSCGAEGLKKN